MVVSDARKIIEKCNVLYKEGGNSLKKRTLKIGVCSGNENIIQPGIMEMYNKFPGNGPIIQLMEPNEALGKIKKGALDVCFVRPPIPTGLVSLKVSQDHLAIGVNDSFFNELHGELTDNNMLELLSSMPLIRLKNNPDIQMTNMINYWMRGLNISFSSVLYVNTTYGLISAILSGRGCGFFIKNNEFVRIPGVHYVPLMGKFSKWDVEMVWDPSKKDKLRDCFIEGYGIDK